GIRDRNVTGVQTCALPISIHQFTHSPIAASVPDGGYSSVVERRTVAPEVAGSNPVTHPILHLHVFQELGVLGCDFCRRVARQARSEERRVGKECRYGSSAV